MPMRPCLAQTPGTTSSGINLANPECTLGEQGKLHAPQDQISRRPVVPCPHSSTYRIMQCTVYSNWRQSRDWELQERWLRSQLLVNLLLVLKCVHLLLRRIKYLPTKE